MTGDRGRKDAAIGTDAKQAQREKSVLELSAIGLSSRKIAAKLGISHTEVLRRLNAAIQELHAESLDLAEMIRDRQLGDIEMIRERLLPVLNENVVLEQTIIQVVGGEPVEMKVPVEEWQKCKSVALTLMKVYEREAKLAGADAPEKVDFNPKAPLSPEEIIERQRLARQRALDVAMGRTTGGSIEE